MSEDNTDKVPQTRITLGSISNYMGKRGFSSISGNENLTNPDGKENLVKERHDSKIVKLSDQIVLPLKGGKSYRFRSLSGKENVDPNIQIMPFDNRQQSSSRLHNPSPNVVETATSNIVFAPVVAESLKLSKRNPNELGKESQKEVTGHHSDPIKSDLAEDELALKVVSSDSESLGVDHLARTTSTLDVPSTSTGLKDLRAFGLERCTELKADGCFSLGGGLDLINSCSCSFCTKASYIWADLHYQDVKGRISTLAKSQREASNLVQRYSKEELIRHGQASSSDQSRLEIDLMSQWKSLFMGMESVFSGESNQLQTSLVALKEMRDNFKTSLETTKWVPPDMRQCSSDASDHHP